MLRRLRKRFWAVHLVTVLLCAFFAARAAGQYLTGPAAGSAPTPMPQRQTVTAQSSAQPSRDTRTILSRNIFCSDCAPVAPTETPARSGSELARSALPLRLLATLVDADNADGGFASLFDPGSGRTRVAAVGETLALEARLIAVEERRILLENCAGATDQDCRKEFLPLEEAAAGAVQPAVPAPAGRPMIAPAAPSMVRSTAPGQFEIPRDALNAALSNTVLLARSARIMPAQLQGQPAGFMVTAIRPGSLYTQLGLQDGDIIQGVSGHSIRAPEDALQLMTQLRSAQHVTLSFLRHSRPMTYDYTVTNR